MPRRFLPYSLGVAGLLLVAGALWLPDDFGSRSQADPAAEPATSDISLVARECPYFLTFRPADFTGDELVKAVIQDLPKFIEEQLHVSSYGIERLTLAVARHGTVQIVRTKKAYDADKLREALTGPRYRYSSKDKAVIQDKAGNFGEPEKPAIQKKKVGGKTIYYTGSFSRWTQGWCPIDKKSFLYGDVSALEGLLKSKGKPSAEMTEALSLASNHSLVMALDGKRLRTMLKQLREDQKKSRLEMEKRREQRFDEKKFVDKDKGGFKSSRNSSPDFTFVSARKAQRALPAEADDKPKEEEDDLDMLFDGPGMGAVLMPYKPLLGARFGLLTLDIKKAYTLTAKVDFNKDDLADGETALKSVLYVARQLVVMLPKQEREFAGLKPLGAPLQKAFKEAKIVRKGTTLSTTITLTPEAGMVKKVREGIAEEKKKRDDRYKRGPGRSIPRDSEKPTFKDAPKE